MASLPVQMADGSENIIYKSYNITGGGTGDYFYVYRIGNLRVVRAKLPSIGSGTTFLTLDAVDRPSAEFYLPNIDFAGHQGYCIKINTNGTVVAAGSTSAGTYASGSYVTSATSV